METFFGILGVIVIVIVVGNYLSAKREEEEYEEHAGRFQETRSMRESSVDTDAGDTHAQSNSEMNNSERNVRKPDTLGLMYNTLETLGCQPKMNDDGTLSVSYQGENFTMEFGGMYARVWDPLWSGIKADNPDLPKVREAVNVANFGFGPTVVMTAPDEDGVIGFHSRRDIMLHPACPDNVPFVRAVLDSFFEVKEQVRQCYQQLNARQAEAQKKRRPVGFTANSEN